MADDVSPVDPFPRTRVPVKDAEMAYVEVGSG
jgi:haloalkane dehalogenase